MITNYIKWCWTLKCILPWQVALVSHEELTPEQYELPENITVPSDSLEAA
jgi:hypothetical protein